MLYEQYRPQVWSDLVGQEKAVRIVRRILERPGFDRGAFWIEGAGEHNSGIGKTSLALLIAHQLADPFFVEQLSGAKVDRATVKRIEQVAWLSTWGDKPFARHLEDERSKEASQLHYHHG